MPPFLSEAHMQRRYLLLVTAVSVLGLGAALLLPRRAAASGYDCFATVIGCGAAWIKTCNCTPP